MALNLWIPPPPGGSASGLMPRMSPHTATGGNPKHSRTTNRHQPVKVMHWNAEGVLNKQTDLQHVLHKNNITICCIQETHLQPKKYNKVRGYQCLRSYRIGRSKGGILTLVRNNIDAIQTTTHIWLRVPSYEPKEEGFSYEVREPLLSKWLSVVP